MVQLVIFKHELAFSSKGLYGGDEGEGDEFQKKGIIDYLKIL